MSDLQAPLLQWYDEHARDLPWRGAAASPWSVMVSEYMLQQTPVARVLPVHAQWLQRWPTPADLAAEPAGEAIRMWGRLGYPRRALRLHAAATAIVERHDGGCPRPTTTSARSRGSATTPRPPSRCSPSAGATPSSTPTCDGCWRGPWPATSSHRPPPPAASATGPPPCCPHDDADAATWSIAVMELGALVCTSNKPRCEACPVADRCAWLAAGSPAYDGPPRRGQAWAGTDRQCRGRLMAVLRDADGPVPVARLARTWDEADQRTRCLAGLVEDGLVVRDGDAYALP